MKKRDVILDFTSLLDVTLIVIFFFVLFSHLDSQENKIRTDEKIQELETAIQDAESREEEAQELMEQLENEISIVRDYSDRHASNASEILVFNRGENIKVILDIENADNWSIRVIKGDVAITIIAGNENIGSELINALEGVGYSETDTVFCDLVYNGNVPGTNKACRMIENAIEEVSEKYKYFYVSETDLSIGGE